MYWKTVWNLQSYSLGISTSANYKINKQITTSTKLHHEQSETSVKNTINSCNNILSSISSQEIFWSMERERERRETVLFCPPAHDVTVFWFAGKSWIANRSLALTGYFLKFAFIKCPKLRFFFSSDIWSESTNFVDTLTQTNIIPGSFFKGKSCNLKSGI